MIQVISVRLVGHILAAFMTGSFIALAQAGETRLVPAEGLEQIPIFATSSALGERTVPAAKLDGVFDVLKVSGNGMMQIVFEGEHVWVDPYDVKTPDLKAGSGGCIELSQRNEVKQGSRALGDRCP